MELIIDLFERLGIFAILFIFIIRFKGFKRLLTGHANHHDTFVLALIFGLAGVAATYSGFAFHGAIANLRGVAVALGGILGGPLVGLISGLIAGVHRYLIDPSGFTALSCGVATAFQGVTAAVLYHHLRRKDFDIFVAALVGAINEGMKMVFILFLAHPFDAAVDLVRNLIFPSVLVNSLGVAVFVQLVSAVFREQEMAKAEQAQCTLNIIFRTLPFLRHGLTARSAQETASIIKKVAKIDAVLISGNGEILAHEGMFRERPCPVHIEDIGLIKRAHDVGRPSKAQTAREVNSRINQSVLKSGIVVPLKKNAELIGTLGLFRAKEQGITPLDIEMANGLSQLFSNQLELAEIDNQRQLTAAAEIKALQAQINPHFFFNALNTINSFTRSDPLTASKLLVKLADFFRRNTDASTEAVPLAVELEHCEAYLAIEKARFEDRIKMYYDIDKSALDCIVPPFILQPLVENSIRHGILPRAEGGHITITVARDAKSLLIRIADNGVGIAPAKLRDLLREGAAVKSGMGLGIALKNVNNRLVTLYGKKGALNIDSEPGIGTAISFSIPLAI